MFKDKNVTNIKYQTMSHFRQSTSTRLKFNISSHSI